MPDPIVSTGRGGAGNIGADPTVYADGGIVREGAEVIEGSHGRGGAGNIGKSPRLGPQEIGEPRRSTDIVPELAQRPSQENFHTGRGGGGNVYKEKYGGHSNPPGETIGDKVKHALGLDKKKDPTSPLAKGSTTADE
ncbi:hypothetical protein P154DRAFT_578719 [Amniculicola lignicola CBS 123094]|uniref:Uncharacterized protein n=1 Tax=Amniculicola lignicola CBS 123094 TaxID=1392246 RepID=A0A6A5W6Q7_9PLEO|nr:hypothetical protein P154DRAFT_578719 [Amniculicola lignicola CBS 123094]